MKKSFILFCCLLNTCFGQAPKKLSRPERDFDTFWTTFNDNYAFFKQKGTNWDSVYRVYRPLVTSRTTEKELVAVLGKMVDPLHDGHITLSRGEDVLYKARRESAFRTEFKGLEKEFWQTVEATLMASGFPKLTAVGPLFRQEPLYYVAQTEAIGYLRITRCFADAESLFDDTKETADTKLMLTLLDSLLQQAAPTKALIVDLRANGGGHGGLELASRFLNEKTLTHYKSVKSKTGFSEPEPQYNAPAGPRQYLKPVFILTNDRTASSAEDFTISLYRQPNVTTIGSHTAGMLSDMYGADLSNGLSFTLSNQVYLSVDGETLEDRGIPVQINVPNTKQDLARKQDPVVQKALDRSGNRKDE